MEGYGMDSVASLRTIEQVPVEVRLKQRRDTMREQLADIERALNALEKQPELLETLNLLRKVGI